MAEASSDRVDLGILTRGRPDDAIRCAQTALQYGSDHLIVWIIVDDDEAAFERIATHFEGNPRVNVILLPIRHYYVRGMNALYLIMRDNGADYFVVSNDDVVFCADNWDQQAAAALALIWPDDRLGILELAGPELCAHYISRVPFIEQAFGGRIAEPAYTFYCSDTELRERARELDRYAWWKGETLLHHAVKADHVRSEVEFWMPFDRAEYARRWREPWRREVWQ